MDQSEKVHTGVDSVDAVVDDIAALVDQPVEEHVAVFESGHDRLRRALDDPGSEGPEVSGEPRPEP